MNRKQRNKWKMLDRHGYSMVCKKTGRVFMEFPPQDTPDRKQRWLSSPVNQARMRAKMRMIRRYKDEQFKKLARENMHAITALWDDIIYKEFLKAAQAGKVAGK